MSRPQPRILLEQDDDRLNTWQILEGDQTFLITYQGQPVSIRVLTAGLGTDRKKYKRMSYTELGTCVGQVKRFNEKFNTTDFDYIRVFGHLNVKQK
jgi:hypothetical protein